MSENVNWVPFKGNEKKYIEATKNNCLCLFANGDIVEYDGDWPYAELVCFDSGQETTNE